MNDPRRQDLDPVTAELLLGGGAGDAAQRWGRTGADADLQALAAALAWASAPATDHELVGEDAAVAAFRMARMAHARSAQAGAADPVERASSRRPSARRWRLAGPALFAATLTAAAAVGLALTAYPLSTPGSGSSVAALNGQETIAHRGVPSPGSARLVSTPPATTTRGPTVTPAATADPALAALCRAYFAKNEKDRAKALKKGQFAPLVDAAGGTDKVDAFCMTLVGSPPTPTPKAKQK